MKYNNVECYTISELSEIITDVHSFYNLKGDFLDYFYSSEAIREDLIMEEPQERADIPSWIQPFLASMVHRLCNEYHINIPEWVWQERFYLKEPRFSHDAVGKMKAWLFINAAPEFKHRNLFVSEDTLSRC